MGLLTRVLGGKWKCSDCGRKYRNEPTECKKCGNTVYERL